MGLGCGRDTKRVVKSEKQKSPFYVLVEKTQVYNKYSKKVHTEKAVNSGHVVCHNHDPSPLVARELRYLLFSR